MWSVALAAEDSTGAEEDAHLIAEELVDSEHVSGGMPQLDATTYPSQILWLVLAFVALYWLLKNKALPRVADILETRQDKIAQDVDRAGALRAEAEAAMRLHEQIVADAQSKSHAQLTAAYERLKAEQLQFETELDAKVRKQLGEAETQIDAMRADALAQLEEVAVDVAQSATERLIGISVTKEDARAALKSVGKEAA